MIILLTLENFCCVVIPTEAIPVVRESEVEESVFIYKDFSTPYASRRNPLEMTILLNK